MPRMPHPPRRATTPAGGRRPARAWWWGKPLAVAAAVFYNSWLAWQLNGHPHAMRGYLSELAATDQPYSWFFRAGDVLAALVFAAIAWQGRRRWRGWLGTWAPRAAWALGVASAATILDQVVAMPCAESRDPECKANPSLTQHLHAVTSSVAGLAFVVLLACVVCALWQAGRRRSAAWVGGLTAVVGGLMLGSAAAPWVAPGTQGVMQAVQVVLCSLSVGWMAWRLERERPRRLPRAGRRPQRSGPGNPDHAKE